jgi:hypothetical protein
VALAVEIVTPVEEFRPGRIDHEAQTVQLLDAHGTVVTSVDGVALEAQFAVDGGHLVVTTDEDPFEGSLHFTLLDGQRERVDVLGLGLPYRAGTFRLHTAGPDESLRFSFFGQEVWRLEVSPRPSLVFARPLGPARYTSGWWRRHRLVLSRIPDSSR